MQHRIDIQALRGYAVLIVVADHAGLNLAPSGFLGVDIFFVISGYLITSIISQSMIKKEFSFREFYFKRARRILPAAYVTVLLTSIGSIWFLTSTEIEPLGNQVLGAVGFFINFVLWQQTDYFAPAANMMPLLHMWSLAVEEQYYIILPLILMVMPARWWVLSAALILLASLVLCFVWVQVDPTGAFYMLPARAWELMIGSLGALYLNRLSLAQRASKLFYWPAIFVLLVMPFIEFPVPHPGLPALGICVATLVVILAQNEPIARSLPVKALGRVGDISYSLYLVHWPIMVFATAAYLGEPTVLARVAAVGIALVCAIAMYVLVEQPTRKGLKRANAVFFGGMVASAFLVVGAHYGIVYGLSRQTVDFAALRAPNYGLDKACDYSGTRFRPKSQCGTTEVPDILVWGDSYAMHLVPGLVDRLDVRVGQATLSACPPLLGATIKSNAENGELASELCSAYNRSVIEYITANAGIKAVVLGSAWREQVDGNTMFWEISEGTKTATVSSPEFGSEQLSRTVEALQKAGMTVFIFAPPPSAGGRDTSACVERVTLGKLVLGQQDCGIGRAAAMAADNRVEVMLQGLEARYGVKVIRISDALCDQDSCATSLDGFPVYRDGGHLSNAGSVSVMRRLDLSTLISATTGASGNNGQSATAPIRAQTSQQTGPQLALAGSGARLTFDVCDPADRNLWQGADDPLGTFVCGMEYLVKYDASTGLWNVTGPQESEGFNPSDFVPRSIGTPGPPPSEGEMILWGALFNFDQSGNVYQGYSLEPIGKLLF